MANGAGAPATPMVSCIMPTRNRRRFAGQAIAYFLRQDYPNRELVVVDDGEDCVADLVPDDARVRYRRLDGPAPSLGAKRNLAVELARGDLIAHWDDDDWMSPGRLSRQVAELARGGDVSGAPSLLYYRPETGEAWRYDAGPHPVPWLAGCTLMYRRSLWEERPFPGLQVGEDAAFLAGLSPDRARPTDLDADYVALLHPGNTAPKNLADGRWRRRPLDDVVGRLAPDREFYAGLRGGRAPAAAPAPAGVTVVAPFVVHEGYGSMAEYLVLGMARAGAGVDVLPLHLHPAGLTDELLDIRRGSRPRTGAPVLYFSWPRPELERFSAEPELFISTMWESSRLPRDWPARLNRARAVVVPTRFVAGVCRRSGVRVPIEVVPHGVDPAVYRHLARPPRAGITTLVVATVTPRKHTLEAIRAWKLAFAGDPEARLLLKARFQYGNYAADDPRIRLVDADEPTRGIAHWYREADVLLALGSEGFGLPLVEGMATGLPVIALSSEGQGDVCEDAGDLLLPVAPARWEPVDEAPYGPAGVRGVPDVAEVADRLRWVAGHRAEAAAMGEAASAWALRHRSAWAIGPATLDAMERHLARPRRLRRPWAMWVPSLGAPCGISEYARHLAEHLPGLRLAAGPGLPADAVLLHVQHEPSLLADGPVAEAVERARGRGLPVVVTEHVVGPAAPPWEELADVVTTTTARGAAVLARRRPGHARHLEHGCPTWFPPRKRARGRVIGAVGFLEPHKGFWRLLEVLGLLAGAELLLFSHAKGAEVEARWEAAARGLPVRREGRFLPAEEIARRLACEADVLVFWYDESRTAQASGAVRLGLASGVPVLASRTAWFEGLGEAVFQPPDLVEGVRRLLEDDALRDRVTAAARAHCEEHSWPRAAERHLALWRSLTAR